MNFKYGLSINKEIIKNDLKRLTNQVYKLLPEREEKIDWQSPLKSIILEFAGMDRLLLDQGNILFPLLCKLEGLLILTQDEDFYMFRKTIFECLSLIDKLKESLCED